MIKEKLCGKCSKNKPFKEFAKDKTKKDEHTSVCKTCRQKQNKEYNARPDIKVLKIEYRKKYYVNNKNYILDKTRKYYKENKERYGEYSKQYSKIRRKVDPAFALQKDIRSIITRMVRKGAYKSKHSNYYVGCTAEELRKHLESQFKEGMSWKNRSEWHIDHIIPLIAFDMRNEQHVVLCSNWANLRPLWRLENLSRPKKYTTI